MPMPESIAAPEADRPGEDGLYAVKLLGDYGSHKPDTVLRVDQKEKTWIAANIKAPTPGKEKKPATKPEPDPPDDQPSDLKPEEEPHA